MALYLVSVFALIVLLLSVAASENSALALHSAVQQHALLQLMQTAEMGLVRGEQQLQQGIIPRCTYVEPQHWYTTPCAADSWSASVTCPLQQGQVLQRLEHLTSAVLHSDGHYVPVDYYRITTRAVDKQQTMQVVLQSTVAITDAAHRHALSAESPLLGRQSWRQLC